MNKIFAIGDIHGCFDKLKNLMKTIPVDLSNDTLLFIGDYIDRAPDGPKVVDYVLALKKNLPVSSVFAAIMKTCFCVIWKA